MSQADDIDPYASLQEWIAYAIRKHRKAAGITQKQLANYLSVVEAQIQHLEAGRRLLHIDHAKALDALWDTDDLFLKLWTHSQREHNRDWFRKYTVYERCADVIWTYQPFVIPGLFQTPDYAWALLDAGHVLDVDGAVAARMERQEIIRREDPPTIWALIGEAALREPVGGSVTHRGQLVHLLDLAKLRHVTIQVIRSGSGAHVGLDGGFTLLEADDEKLAFVEAQLTGRLVRDEIEVKTLGVWYDQIRAKAISEDDSLLLIADILESA